LSQRQVDQAVDPLVAFVRAGINGRQVDMGQALATPGLDPMDYAMAGVGEFEQRMNNARDWILGSIESLRIWAAGNTLERTHLFAKLIALSALISVLIAISRFVRNEVELCEEIVDPDSGKTIVVPKFDAVEFLGMIDLAPFSEIIIPTDNVDGIPVPGPPAIINTETGSKFTIVNCAKGKSKQLVIWKRNDCYNN
jgi:hypothetical protein